MSMDHIRRTYGVPAKRGGRVRFSGNIGREPLVGTIIGSTGAWLCVRFDGEVHRRVLHPTWEIEYEEHRQRWQSVLGGKTG
jgi:hypothetical protein